MAWVTGRESLVGFVGRLGSGDGTDWAWEIKKLIGREVYARNAWRQRVSELDERNAGRAGLRVQMNLPPLTETARRSGGHARHVSSRKRMLRRCCAGHAWKDVRRIDGTRCVYGWVCGQTGSSHRGKARLVHSTWHCRVPGIAVCTAAVA